jgi:hypothetical protein
MIVEKLGVGWSRKIVSKPKGNWISQASRVF